MDAERGAGQNDVDELRRRSFYKGLNVGLVFPAAGWCLWLALWTVRIVPPHSEVFKSVGVTMPPMTIFMISYYWLMALGLVLAAAASIVGTVLRADRQYMGRINVGVFFGALLYQGFLHLTMSLPLISLLEGIGGR